MYDSPQPHIGGPRAGPAVSVRDKVRLYEGNAGWFRTGLVTEIDTTIATADVDFCDFVQRYPLDALRPDWPEDGTYERCLIPLTSGETIDDFRDD